jgi:hypothetical protein
VFSAGSFAWIPETEQTNKVVKGKKGISARRGEQQLRELDWAASLFPIFAYVLDPPLVLPAQIAPLILDGCYTKMRVADLTRTDAPAQPEAE